MSATKYDNIQDLQIGSYDYKIRVRVIRLWRGATRTGEQFKNFNVILLDNKSQRMHAWIPTSRNDEMARVMHIGNIYKIRKFTVQFHKPTDKFRCLRNDKQIVFTKDTTVQDMAENEVMIPLDYFDFYEHSQLKELSEQTTYLTDVVGIIKRHEDFRDLENKHGQKQKQSKLVITDGRSNVNITFWDSFGIKFETDMKQVVQKPVIIIISCCRVGKWDGEIDISNVPATRIYLNYKHHVVDQLRKMLANPDFVKQALAEKKKMEILLMKIEDIKKLGKEYIDNKVLTHIRITSVEHTTNWCYTACSGCWKEIKLENSIPVCEPCNRFVPYPEIRYRISVKAEDATGEVQVILGDREVRTLILKRARQLLEEHAGSGDMPQCLKTLAGKDYSVVLNIKEMNISKSFHVYWASNICNGFIRWGEKNRTVDQENTTSTQNQPTTSTNTGQTTTSTYTGQGISDLDLAST